MCTMPPKPPASCRPLMVHARCSVWVLQPALHLHTWFCPVQHARSTVQSCKQNTCMHMPAWRTWHANEILLGHAHEMSNLLKYAGGWQSAAMPGMRVQHRRTHKSMPNMQRLKWSNTTAIYAQRHTRLSPSTFIIIVPRRSAGGCIMHSVLVVCPALSPSSACSLQLLLVAASMELPASFCRAQLA
jgi:hypothetical protein